MIANPGRFKAIIIKKDGTYTTGTKLQINDTPWLRLRRDVTLTRALALRRDVTVAIGALNPYSYVDLTLTFCN